MVLCKPAALADGEHALPEHACAKGLCAKCGWNVTTEVKATAAQLETMGMKLSDMVVTETKEGNGVEVGWRLTAVDGHRVTSPTAANKKMRGGVVMLLQTPEIRPELLFARCPLETSPTQQMTYRETQIKEQPRAHPSYSKDGEVTTTKKVRSTNNNTIHHRTIVDEGSSGYLLVLSRLILIYFSHTTTSVIISRRPRRSGGFARSGFAR